MSYGSDEALVKSSLHHAKPVYSATTARSTSSKLLQSPPLETSANQVSSPLIVIGAAAIDIVSRPSSNALRTTAAGSIALSLGGVARNIFEAAYRLGIRDALLIAPVGNKHDALEVMLKQGLETLGTTLRGLVKVAGRTPAVNMMLDSQGELLGGVADTGLAEEMTGSMVGRLLCSPAIR